MERAGSQNQSRYWVADDVGGIELLHARFRRRRFVPHTHETYTLGVILEGALGFDRERHSMVAPAGTISLVNPGELHTGFGAADEGWTYRNFFLPAGLMVDIAEELGLHGLPFFSTPVIDDPELSRNLLELHRLLEVSNEPLERQSTAWTVLAGLISTHAVATQVSQERVVSSDAVAKAVERIHDEFHLPLTLEELVEGSGLSRFQLLRLFRRRMGTTPHAYLLQVRIERPKERLLRGEAIADTAAACGFFDQSHLTRRCKEVFGVTPGILAQG